jgi:hypothetical protein
MELKDFINDNYMAALIGFITSLITLFITQRLNNQDQDKNKVDNFFFKDESDYRRIMSWILKETKDVSVDNFDKDNPNLRKSVTEYFLLLSSQYFRYKLSLKNKHLAPLLKNQYDTWEEHIRKNLDFPFYRQAWDYVKHQMHLTGEFSRVIDRLSTAEALKDEKK